MAGHARFTAVLDACVLYQVAIADALMSVLAEGLYEAGKVAHRLRTRA